MAKGPGAGFKCCAMCARLCFETHGDFGRSEAQQLLSSPTFFRLIKASHIEGSKYLRIPVSFYEKWTTNIGGTLSLQGPCGIKCLVTAERDSHGHVLRTGFDSFVKQNMIEAGDSLVFYLMHPSHFVVKVYDRCGNEKKDASTMKTVTDAEQEEDPEDSDGEGSGEKAVDRKLKLRQKKLSMKKVEVSSMKEAKERLRSNQREQPAARVAKQENCVDVSPVSKHFNVGDMKQPVSSRELRSARRRKLSATPDAYHTEESENKLDVLSESEREKAKMRQVKDANDLIEKLGNTSQLVILTDLDLNQVHLGQLQLLLPKVPTYLTLVDERDEQYNVKWRGSKKHPRSRLSTGWNQIVADHSLHAGDVCVFEVNDPFLIKVHIFSLAKYCNPTVENLQQEQDHRDDLQPSVLEHSMSEEVDCLGSQEEDTMSAGFRPTM